MSIEEFRPRDLKSTKTSGTSIVAILHRLRVPDSAQPRSPIAASCKRARQRIGFVLVLFIAVCCSTAQSHGADTLECPEIGSGSVPDLIGDAAGGGLFTTENRVDLANEINEAFNRLQIASLTRAAGK